jgi:hypothetical protein
MAAMCHKQSSASHAMTSSAVASSTIFPESSSMASPCQNLATLQQTNHAPRYRSLKRFRARAA